MSTPTRMCHFLRMPTEIRAQVYRHLLLPRTRYFLRNLKGFRRDSDAGSFQEPFPSSDYPESEREEHPTLMEDDDESDVSSLHLEPRNLEILRTNRQIYSEAIGLFYSELQIVVAPADMVSPASVNEIVTPCRKLWKYDPFHGIGTRQENGEYTYNTPQLDGFLEPHIFARFQHIELDLEFDFDGLLYDIDHDISPKLTFHIDKDLKVRDADIDAMRSLLQQTNLFNNFAQVLSNSLHIRSLEITICVTVAVEYPSIKDLLEPYNPETHDENLKVVELFEGVAGKKAGEVLLESGILEPLKQLGNVRTFNIQVEDSEKGYGLTEPEGVAGDIARELKQAIEQRYQLLHNGGAISLENFEQDALA